MAVGNDPISEAVMQMLTAQGMANTGGGAWSPAVNGARAALPGFVGPSAAPLPAGAFNTSASVANLYGSGQSAAPTVARLAAGQLPFTGPAGVNSAASVAGLYGGGAPAAQVPVAAARVAPALAPTAAAGAARGGVFAGLAGLGGRGAITRAGLPAAAGYFAGQAADAVVPGQAGGILAGAATGAGIGAGIGSLIPIPGVGTGVGAAVGGLAGGLIGAFGPKDTGEEAVDAEMDAQTERLTEVLNQFGASEDLREQALLQLQLGAINADSKDQVRQIADGITSQLGTAILQDRQTQEVERFREANMAAVQAWLGPMMQQSLNQQQFYANQQAAVQRAASQQYNDPALRAASEALAAQGPATAASQAAYQLAQLASTPALYGFNTGVDNQGLANVDLASILSAVPAGANPAAAQFLASTQG